MNQSVDLLSDLARHARVGVMISNAWPESRSTVGATAEAIQETLREFPHVGAIQTVDVPTAPERREIRRIVHDAGLGHTYMLTRRLNLARLNLSALDAKVRNSASALVREGIEEAVEIGANTIGLISGARPANPVLRAEALRCLEQSLGEICAEANKAGVRVVIEPLDYEADKRATLGTTEEAVQLCNRLDAAAAPLSLAFDTAHALLNREDVTAAFQLAQPHVTEFHLCNAVIDPSHPLYGDKHLPFGAPGAVDVRYTAELFHALGAAGFFNPEKPRRLMCEVLKPADRSSIDVVRDGLHWLARAWAATQR